MKKFFIILALTLVAFTANAQIAKWMGLHKKVATATLKGDANSDGQVTVADVMLVVNYVLGKEGSSFNSTNADVNGDGEITIADVMQTVDNIIQGSGGNGGTSQSYLTCPDDHHPHMIDLGLPSGTKWACCNVDTEHPENQSPTNYGGYYAWGETEVKDYYDVEGYEFFEGWDVETWTDGDDEEHEEYFPIYTDLGEIAGTEYDVAHVKWGNSWRMPSSDQINELLDNCSYEWTTLNGVNGVKFTSTNGSSIFLPAAGIPSNSGRLFHAGSQGYYWSSTQYPSDSYSAYDLIIRSDFTRMRSSYRDNVQSVRPVVIGSTSTDPHLQLSEDYIDLISDEECNVEITSGSGSYTVESSDEEVVSVYLEDNVIYIHGSEGGYATITVTDIKTGETATIEVSVTAPYFYFSENYIVMEVGETAKVHYENNTDFGYCSSDESVATVDCSGGYFSITAVGPGSATIEVDYGYSGPIYHATLEVTVTGNTAPVSYLACPDDHHPHMIDLGLPSGTKWACCNVDTEHPENQSPTNYGGYYAWGETEVKNFYDKNTYEYYQNGNYIDIGSDIAGTKYDVAHVKWGGSWVMPSIVQIRELLANCTYTWVIVNGVDGGLFTGLNGSIFLPAAGGIIYRDPDDVGSYGRYWSSTKSSSDSHARCFVFCKGATTCDFAVGRLQGKSVRPVSR